MTKMFKIIFSLFSVKTFKKNKISKIKFLLLSFELTFPSRDTKFFVFLKGQIKKSRQKIGEILVLSESKIDLIKKKIEKFLVFSKPILNWAIEKIKIIMIILVQIILITIVWLSIPVLKFLFFNALDYVSLLHDICLKIIIFLETERYHSAFLSSVFSVKIFLLSSSFFFFAISSELFYRRNFMLSIALYVDNIVLRILLHLCRCFIGFTTLSLSFIMFCYGYFLYRPYYQGFEDLHALIILLILVVLFFIAGVCYILYEEYRNKE